MGKIVDMLVRVAPIFAMLAAGYLFQRRRFLSPEIVAGIKSFVSKLTLPAVVFGAFSGIKFDADTPVVFIVIFLCCAAGLLIGYGLDALLRRKTVRPFLMSSFEAGMLGFPLFAIVFGPAGLPRIAMCDLGEIVFTFAVLLPLLNARSGGERGIRPQLRRLAHNPVIWALVIGVIAGLTGATKLLTSTTAGRTVAGCVSFLGAPTGALILFIVGYELEFSRSTIAASLSTILARYLVWIPFFFLAWAATSRFAPGADSVLRSAFMVLFILPPTFAIPVFGAEGEESRFIATTLSLNSFVAIVLLAGVAVLA
jgi:malate permease and related proteins